MRAFRIDAWAPGARRATLGATPANSVFIFVPHAGHSLLQEAGVSIAETMTGVDIDFLVGEVVVEIR